MRVRLTFGRMAGEVVDLPVPSARAMLADGRAVSELAPVADAETVAAPSVELRSDRGMPRGKRRAVR